MRRVRVKEKSDLAGIVPLFTKNMIFQHLVRRSVPVRLWNMAVEFVTSTKASGGCIDLVSNFNGEQSRVQLYWAKAHARC